MSRTGFWVSLLCLGLFAPSSIVNAQGLLLSSEPSAGRRLPRPISRPVPGQPGFLYDISKLEIDASIRGQVAEVQVGQTFKNCTSRTLQVKFVFPLPYDGAVDQMTFMVDGQELEGRLLEADKAREIYQSYVRRSQDPALVQWIGTGMFQTQVFPVPPGAERTVSLRYTQLCRRVGSMNDWTLPLSPARYTSKPIGEISIRGRIRGDGRLGNVYSPTHDVKIDREGSAVRFNYHVTGKVPDSHFRMMWDSGDDAVQMSMVAYRPDRDQDGYFMLMIQPDFPEPDQDSGQSGKNVVLVMDKSGSMRGDKIEQARRAASHVIGKLKSRDQFTLITYDSNVETFRSELTSADKPTRADAMDYIDSMLAGGSTNINDALKAAFDATQEADGPAYVVFMTDGRPTVGVRNSMQIAENAADTIREGTRLFSLGVGHDVNSRLLDKLSEICLGQTLYVRPEEPIDKVVKTLYERIGAPALTDARLKITVDGKEGGVRQLYPSDMYDLFSGDQLVIVGRYRKHGAVKIRLSGDFEGSRQEFKFDDELPKQTGSGQNAFVERLWATRRIGQIIDEIDLHGQEKELIDELIALSKRHGILTPYTAYLAEEETNLNDRSRGLELARRQLGRLGNESGADAFFQREFKSQLRNAPRAEAADASEALAQRIPLYATPAPSANAPTRGRAGAARPQSAPNGFGGFAGGGGGALGGRSSGQAVAGGILAVDEAAAEGKKADGLAKRLKQVGDKAFYYKENRYVDPEADEDQIKKATKIARFSDEYFKLLDDLGDKVKHYLAETEDILFVVDGKSYWLYTKKE